MPFILSSIQNKDNQYQQMGQNQSKPNSIIDSNWTTVQDNDKIVFHNINPYCKRTLYNSTTKEYAEEYELQFSSQQDYQCYARELQQRRQPPNSNIRSPETQQSAILYSPYVFKVKYFINVSVEDLCSSVYKGLLYIDKVDLRLKEINDIPFQDQLYVIRATLQGFKVLYQKVGYFDITEEMIFISCKGKVKVWIHPNLSQNQPYYIPHSHESQQLHGSQSEMIVNLINIIEENTDTQHLSNIHFKQYLIKKGILDRLSFYKALEEFRNYCQEERLVVGSLMKSIYELYHDEQSKFSESRADRSQVYRVQTGHDFNHANRHDLKQYKSVQRPNIRRASPVINQLYKSHASQQSYQSHRKTNLQNHKQIQQPYQIKPYYEPPFIPTLPLKVSVKNSPNMSPRNKIEEVSFGKQPQFYQDISFNQISQPYIATSRRNSIINGKRAQNKANLPIRFNYQSIPQANPPTSSIPIPQKMKSPAFLKSINTINSQSSFSNKETDHFYEFKSKEYSRVKYYSPNEIFSLDTEIAQDLQKFLGFNIKNL